MRAAVIHSLKVKGMAKPSDAQNMSAFDVPEIVDFDEALRRPGRFDREIVINVPDESGRREILAIHTRGMPLGEKVDLKELARITHGFVGADIAALAREAAIDAVRRIMPKLDLDERTIPPEVHSINYCQLASNCYIWQRLFTNTTRTSCGNCELN